MTSTKQNNDETINKILVTNPRLGLFNKPLKDVHPKAVFIYDEKYNELDINGSLFVHVFGVVPECLMRKNSDFRFNTYHITPINEYLISRFK